MNHLKPKIFYKSSPRKERCLTAWEHFFRTQNISYQTDRKLAIPQFYSHNLAIIFGSWKNRKDSHHQIKNKIIDSNKNFICCETSLLGRQKVTNKFNEDWFRVGINGFLANTGNFNQSAHITPERWQMIKEVRNIEVVPWNHNQGIYITICLQLPGDASLQGADINLWMLKVCRSIRAITDFPIKIRFPQLKRTFNRQHLAEAMSYPNMISEEGTKENLNKTIDESSFICTYSSGMGIDAVLRGTPIFAESKASFVYSVSTKLKECIEGRFNTPDRSDLLKTLAYCQWSKHEIETGMAWDHLITSNKLFLKSNLTERFYLPLNK